MRKRSSIYRCARAAAIVIALSLPVPGTAADIAVPAGGNLQAALDAAQPGDTVLLAPGATYVGNFVLPVHGGTTYVTLRTGGNDALLPDAETRITPAHAPYLAKLRSPNSVPALRTMARAAYWRVMLLEFRANANGAGDIMRLGNPSTAQNSLDLVPHHLIVDRVYMHGDPLVGQKRGIHLNSADTLVINSHIDEMKAIGQDTQALGGANGPGPFRIENNHLEAGGEVFILGGDDPKIPGLVTSDVLFRGNTLRRPVSWRDPIVPTPTGVSAAAAAGGSLAAGTYAYRVVARRPAGTTTATSTRSAEVSAVVAAGGSVTLRWTAVPNATGYRVYGRTAGGQTMYWTVQTTSFTDTGAAGTAGTPPSSGTVWQVKNLFELKNARRVQVDYNLMENNWEQAQVGIAVLFSVRNQYGGCLQCVVEDVTFEYNIVRNTGGGIKVLGFDYNHPSQQSNNIRIRHNLFYGLDRSWGGTGYFLTLTEGPRDIVVDHNTIISPNGLGVVGVQGSPVYGFVFTNNVARHNSYGIFGSSRSYGNTAISYYFPNGIIRRNVLAGGRAAAYPADNLFPTTSAFEAHFIDYVRANFALAPGTDWAGAGTDAVDLGADMTRLRSGPAGVAVQPPSTLRVGASTPPVAILTTTLAAAMVGRTYARQLVAGGGLGSYLWSVTSGRLPAGVTLSAGGFLSGTPRAVGSSSFTATVRDAQDATRRASRAFTLGVTPLNRTPTVTVRAGSSGVIPVGATVTFTGNVADADGVIRRVEFLVNGQPIGTAVSAPFRVRWVARDGGPHAVTATAVDDRGAEASSAPLTVWTTPEILIYASDVQRIVGNFKKVADVTAANGVRLWNPNANAAKILVPAASPANYVEFTFYAESGRPYRLWIRGKGERNVWPNDSAYVQFSGTVDAGGAVKYRIGTTKATWYSVEEYGNAGLLKWGWQDNGFGRNVNGPLLYFQRTGLQTLRIQQREDGISFDQIVISPSRYLSAAPGLPKNDFTILAKP